MDLSSLTSISIFTLLFHVSNLMAFLAFLLRDQLKLRLLMAVSFFLQGLYYYSIPGGPLVDPLFWKIVSFAANLGMIALVFGGQLDFGVPEDLRGLFNKIKVLSPGDFRRLIASSTRVLGADTKILVEGETPKHLYFLLKGEAKIIKREQTTSLLSGTFLGEIAFLNATTASATVVLPQGAECVAWDTAKLHDLLRRDSAINIAMRGVFNSDLAQKLATSLPIDNSKAD
jgi:Cyclic nucleotide-binding domain